VELLHERQRISEVLKKVACEKLVDRIVGKRQRFSPARIEVGENVDSGQCPRIEVDPSCAKVGAAAQVEALRSLCRRVFARGTA
jgi:hypothetical protein